MNNFIYGRLKPIKNSISKKLVQPYWQRQKQHKVKQNINSHVIEALNLTQADITEIKESVELTHYLEYEKSTATLPSSYDLFSINDVALPCWQETDLHLYDDWLTSTAYYPIYYKLLRQLTLLQQRTRFLEIGVRTGYLGAVLFKAAQGSSFYMGVDPNLYVRNGLQLASETFKTLRLKHSDFDFTLIEGYSWDIAVQNSLSYSAPFDIIHVDGDHTLLGKLIDLELVRHLVSPKGVVLVDDYEHHPIVSDAIRRSLTLGWFREFVYIPSKIGLAVLRC